MSEPERLSVKIELRNKKGTVIDGFYSSEFNKTPNALNAFWRDIEKVFKEHTGDTVYNKKPL